MAIPCISGIWRSGATSRRSTWVRTIRSSSSCVPPTTRRRRTGSWVSWWTRRTSSPPSGCGTGTRRPARTVAVGGYRRSSRFLQSRRIRTSSCRGTGEMRQYDVRDPFNPKQTGSVRVGGIVGKSPHPSTGPLNGGPQMVEISRDGRRVYFTNSLYASWDEQFYPEGIDGWLVKLDVEPEGGITLDPDFFVQFGDLRPHQALLAGGAGFLLDVRLVRWVCAGLLMTFGVLLLARKIRHRWFGMQVGFGGLTGWSFLMASAHGAGLMVVPALLSLPTVAFVCHVGSPNVAVASVGVAAAGSAFGQGLAAVAVHTASLLAVAAAIAFLVYDRLGLRLLKKAWINLDALWAVALIAAGFLVLFT